MVGGGGVHDGVTRLNFSLDYCCRHLNIGNLLEQ